MLLELFDLHTAAKLGVEDAVLVQYLVTFSTDVNHGSDDLRLDEERVEAECTELLGEVMRRDWHKAEVRNLLRLRLGWQLKVGRDKLGRVVLVHATAIVVVLMEELALLLEIDRLLHDDLVHGTTVIADHFREDASLIDSGPSAEGTGSHSHLLDTRALLSVRLRKLLKRHEVDEEVVADLRVSINALRVGLNNTLGKDARILGVEKQVDASELDVFSRAIPVAAELFALLVVSVDEDSTPVATAILILAEALARDGLHGAIEAPTVLNPLLRQSAVVLSVVEGLKGEPLSRRGLRVTIVDSLYTN